MRSTGPYLSTKAAVCHINYLLLGTLCATMFHGAALGSSEKSSVVSRITAMPEEAYIGGMPPSMVEIAAEVRQTMQTTMGRALPDCDPPDASKGSIVATDVDTSPPQPVPDSSPPLRELQDLLGSERRFVRDAAAFIIGDIGPAARSLAPNLSGEDIAPSPWFSHALGRIGCERYSMSSALDRLPKAGLAELQGPGQSRLPARLRVQLIARLIQQPDLAWPDDFFSSAVESWDLRRTEQAVPTIDVTAIQPIINRVMDPRTPMALRLDLARLLVTLADVPHSGAGQLWPLSEHSDDDLSFLAALAVAKAGGDLAIDANALMMERFDADLVQFDGLCHSNRAAEVLGPILQARLAGDNWWRAKQAAEQLGCVDPIGSAQVLREALEHPSWEVHLAAIGSLAGSVDSDPQSRAALQAVEDEHWSGLVRQHARVALDPPPSDEEGSNAAHEPIFRCFHRCLTDHLRRCGDENGIVDGLYVSPSMGELQIEWERARRVPRPEGFPVLVEEDSRAEYGTSTYLRVDGGWLYGTDRWHYDGEVAFVSDEGEKSLVGGWGVHAAAIIQTPGFGRTLLGGSLFGVGEAGLLASLERGSEGWRMIPRAALPSPPWGWAIAPNGTLLVADPYEAVAVLADGRIEALACPARAPAHRVRKLLGLERHAQARSALERRALSDALETHRSLFSSERDRIDHLARNPEKRERWETPELLASRLNRSMDELLERYLAADRAEEGIDFLAELPDGLVDVRASRRFQLHAIAGPSGQARTQLEIPAASTDVFGLKIQVALALAERRSADVDAALRRIQDLNAQEREPDDSPDHFLEILQWLAAAEGPGRGDLLTAEDKWPGPIQAYFAGRISERELALAAHRRDGQVDREKLSEALFYRGLQLAASGNSRAAQAHFRATLDLGVSHFFEHAVAAELMRP